MEQLQYFTPHREAFTLMIKRKANLVNTNDVNRYLNIQIRSFDLILPIPNCPPEPDETADLFVNDSLLENNTYP